MQTLKTIDAHAGGGPLRLVTEGFPSPRGATMLEKREWARRHADHVRRALMLEPRGHADMCGAVLTEAVSPGSHAGILFMDNEGYGDVLGHGIIAATAIALCRGLLMPGGDGQTIVFDTTAGPIRARAFAEDAAREPLSDGAEESGEDGSLGRTVHLRGVPSFVLHGGLAVTLGGRRIRADVAFGGAFHAIVDAEAAGLPLDAARAPELRRAGMEIRRAVEAAIAVAHPLEPRLRGVHATIFTGPSHSPGADLRTAAVFANAALDRSPSATGVAAIMSVLDAIGLIDSGRRFVCEGLLGTTLGGRASGRTAIGEIGALVPELEGSAWIVGEQTFYVDDADPLRDGFRI